MTNVIDLIDDVGPDMQAEATEQGGDKEWPVHATLAERDRAADRDRQYRCREAEGSDDLPRASKTPSDTRPKPSCSNRHRLSFPSPACGGGQGGGLRLRRISHGGVEDRVDLRALLQDRLQQRNVHPGLVVSLGAGGDVMNRAAQDEGVEQLIRDQLARSVVVLGPPGGRDLAAQRRIESRALHRDIAQHGDHVNHERLALGPVQRFLAAAVEEAEEVAAKIDVARSAPMGRGALQDARAHLLEGGQRLGGPRQVAVGLLPAQIQEWRAVGRDVDRDSMWRLEHWLQWGDLVIELQRLTAPEAADLVDRFRDAGDRVVVGDRHLGKA